MAKEDGKEIEKEYFKILERLSISPALNGGFDRLEENITEIKSMQLSARDDMVKLNSEVSHVKNEFKRTQDKIDRIYDPEEGLFVRILNTENDIAITNKALIDLAESVNENVTMSQKTLSQIAKLKKESDEITGKIKILSNIAGENFEELHSTIKVKKNLSKIIWLFVTGFFGTLAKILWDILSN